MNNFINDKLVFTTNVNVPIEQVPQKTINEFNEAFPPTQVEEQLNAMYNRIDKMGGFEGFESANFRFMIDNLIHLHKVIELIAH